jgi:hypothetical protein
VQVIHGEHERPGGRERLGPDDERVLDPCRELVGRERQQVALDLGIQPQREQEPEVGQDPVLRGAQQRARARAELRPRPELDVALLRAEPRAQELDERPVRRAGPVGDAPALEPGGVGPD